MGAAAVARSPVLSPIVLPLGSFDSPSVVTATANRPDLPPLPVASADTSPALPSISTDHSVVTVSPSEPFCWVPSTFMVLREIFTLKGFRTNVAELKKRFTEAKNTQNYQPFVSHAFDSVGHFFMHLYFLFWFPAALHHLDKSFSKFHPYISNAFRFSRKIPPLANQIFHALYNSFACAGSIIGLIKESYYLKQTLAFRKKMKVCLPQKDLSKESALIKLRALQEKISDPSESANLKKYLRPHIFESLSQNAQSIIDKLSHGRTINASVIEANELLREVNVQTKKLVIIHIIGLAALSFIFAGSLLYLIGANVLIPTAFMYTLIGLALEGIKGLYIKASLDSKGWEISFSKLIPQKFKKANTWKTIGATAGVVACALGFYQVFPKAVI